MRSNYFKLLISAATVLFFLCVIVAAASDLFSGSLNGGLYSLAFIVIFFVSSYGIFKLPKRMMPIRQKKSLSIENGVKFSWVYPVIVAIFAFVLRLSWVLAVRTKPFSDFLHMHNIGVNVSHGIYDKFVKFYGLFPFKFGYSFFVGGVYKLFGSSELTIGITNSIISFFMVLIIYYVGKEVYGVTGGRIACFLAAIWPAQIMYCSVNASEHLFIPLFLLGTLLLSKQLKAKYIKPVYLAISGFVFGISQMIRPISLIVLIAMIILLLINFNISQKNQRQSIIDFLKVAAMTFALIFVGFITSYLLISVPLSKLTGVPVYQASSGINLYIGTNQKSNGMWNAEDFKIIDDFNFDYDMVQKEASKRAFDRIKDDPGGFISLAFRKFSILWKNEYYGYYWSTLSIDKKSPGKAFAMSFPTALNSASQGFYLFILFAAIIGSFRLFIVELKAKKLLETKVEKNFHKSVENTFNSNIQYFLYLVILGLAGSYIFLEIQGRYHMPVIPLFIILAGGLYTYKRESEGNNR